MRLSVSGGRLLSPSLVIQKTNKVIAEILGGEHRRTDARAGRGHGGPPGGLKILRQIAAYVVESGGKRIRPLFLYYLGKAYRADGDELIRLGALLEIVHAASLLHDDVVDAADERRSRPSGAKLFGNKQVVLGGDHLLSSGLKYLNRMENPRYMTVFTDAIQALSAAELLQMQQHFDLKTTRKIHDCVVDGKTAVLFRAAGALVAIQLGERDFYRSDTADLGQTFGRFFQERDDYLDYFDAARLKKKGLQDFLNGIVTVPLLHLLERATKAETAKIRAEWEFARAHARLQNQNHILQLMEKYRIAAVCTAELGKAQAGILQRLSELPEPKPREIISNEFQKILAVRSA